MAAKKKPKRRQAKKRTSDRVSRIAARVLAMLNDEGGHYRVFPAGTKLHPIDRSTGLDWNDAGLAICTVAELKELAASCLSQDEVKGKRGRG